MFPQRIAIERRRLFPPAIFFEDVHFAVAIHVADAHAVREISIAIVGRNRVPFPWLGGIGPIRFGVAVLALRNADQLGFPVAGQVDERWRFVIGLIENLVARPMAFLAFWIFVPRSVLAGKTDDQNVIPA